VSRPAPFMAAVRSQTLIETRLTARRAENLLAMIGIPVAVLVFFAAVGRDPGTILASTLALAIVASSLVNLGIATAYERGYGVLKRLGGAPLGRSGLLMAKLTVVLGIAILQVVALVVLATVLGWRPNPSTSWLGVAVATIVGVAAFAGLGLFLAGALRPEAALVAANALFVVAILLGGILVPIADLPAPLPTIAGLLPIGALTDAFASALAGTGGFVAPVVLVGAWAVVAFGAAAGTFRWE
jgi:ABC-2 type transport system permease protein